MALKDHDERRNARRFPLPKPAHATFGGFAANIVEVSLIGCQIEHVDRIAPRVRLSLRFQWFGAPVRIDATVMRSEMRSIGGKTAYASGLAFCESPAESPAVIREIVEWLTKAAETAAGEQAAAETHAAPQAASAPSVEAQTAPRPFLRADEDEADAVSAPYLQCRLSGRIWERLYVEDPHQPPEGFTIMAPANDTEADVLCRAYQAASTIKRREMRMTFEQAIAKSRRRNG